MSLAEKLFGKIRMSWGRVLLFSLIAGAWTGIVCLFPFLEKTSLHDIAVTFEWWVLFALVIVTNCKKSWDAALKCFVFFLISQPLCFAVQVLFGSLALDKAWYYLRLWLPKIILTLPGGFVAYYCRKQNWLGGAILGLGNALMLFLGADYFRRMLSSFPYHLLTVIVCFGGAVVTTLAIQKKAPWRILSLGIAVFLAAALVILQL